MTSDRNKEGAAVKEVYRLLEDVGSVEGESVLVHGGDEGGFRPLRQ